MEDIFIYVPQTHYIIRIAQGTGDNLLDEDIENGYEDYVIYDEYDLRNDFEEVDGGQLLLEKTPNSLEEVIPEVLAFIFDEQPVNYILLK